MKVSANSGINANKVVLHFTHAKDSRGVAELHHAMEWCDNERLDNEGFGGLERSQQHKKTQNQGDGGV